MFKINRDDLEFVTLRYNLTFIASKAYKLHVNKIRGFFKVIC